MKFYLTDDWGEVRKIAIFALGKWARSSMGFLQELFEILFIIDNDKSKEGTEYRGIPIVSVDSLGGYLLEQKIIIMTVNRNANEISKQLTSLGLTENKDFCTGERFTVEWFWRFRRETVVTEIHTSVSTKCTFKCQNCNMFMPYYKMPADMGFDALKKDFDALFSNIDKVFHYELLGGEPFLNRDFDKILDYLCKMYGKRIGRVGIVSNGSIVPKKECLDVMKKHRVFVNISDYTSQVDYKQKLDEVVSKLNEYGIEYVVRPELRWCDFGFPMNRFNFDDDKVREHMLNCGPSFHGVNDQKLYYCHVAWSAEKCGLLDIPQNEYIDLSKDVDKEEMLEYCLGNMECQYITMCKVCGGCGYDNKKYVPAGAQMGRNSNI